MKNFGHVISDLPTRYAFGERVLERVSAKHIIKAGLQSFIIV